MIGIQINSFCTYRHVHCRTMLVRNVHGDLASIQLDDLNWVVGKTQAFSGTFNFVLVYKCTILIIIYFSSVPNRFLLFVKQLAINAQYSHSFSLFVVVDIVVENLKGFVVEQFNCLKQKCAQIIFD